MASINISRRVSFFQYILYVKYMCCIFYEFDSTKNLLLGYRFASFATDIVTIHCNVTLFFFYSLSCAFLLLLSVTMGHDKMYYCCFLFTRVRNKWSIFAVTYILHICSILYRLYWPFHSFIRTFYCRQYHSHLQRTKARAKSNIFSVYI